MVSKIKLNTNFEMPMVGLGTWQATGAPVQQAVKDALEIGYRHIDTASDYNNEEDVGKALTEAIAKGVVKREDVFITTKVWPRSSAQKAIDEVNQSLKKINVTYLDLVLLHFPWDNYTESYKGLEQIYDQKLSRSIGVSNFNNAQLDTLLKVAKVKPAVNQIQTHPFANADDELAHCKSLGIAVTAYSPLGTGQVTKNAELADIGKKYTKSASQVALRWQVQRGVIVIPKSTHKEYIKEDFEIFDFTLTDEEMKAVHDLRP